MILLTPAQVKRLMGICDRRADYIVIESNNEPGSITVTKWFGTDHSQVTINPEGK